MKRFITLLSGLFLAALIGLAQGKWEQVSVTPYGTGGINRSGERIDNSYSAGKFSSEVKSTSKNNPYVYFRKAQFSVPGKTFRPGETFTVSMNLTVKRHSGNGTPKGNAGAVIVNGKAGQGTSVPTQVSVSGKDAAKSGSVTLSVPSHSAAGNNFSIVYSCFDIKVVYLYRWAEDKPAAAEQPARIEEIPVVADELVMPDDTILPPADSVAFEEEPVFEFPDVDSLALQMHPNVPTIDSLKISVQSVHEVFTPDIYLSIFCLDLTKKDTILYGIIAGLGLLLLILLLVLIFRKNPAKKAAKEEAKKAAAEAKAAARAEAAEKAAAAKAAAAEKAAAMKAEREAKLAEQKAAAAEKAAAAKAEREAKLAEQKAAQEAKRAELKAVQEAKAAELKAKKEAAAAAAAAKAAEQKARAAEKPVEKPAEKPAEEPKPAGKRFCENCGAPLDADAAFCDNCGTKVE